MRHTFNAAAAVAATFSLLSLASAATTCGPGSLCPSDAPCCSQYGQCGVGAYCLGGCDPQYSFDLKSCVAVPVCKSADYKLTSLDDVTPNTKFLGGPGDTNWVSSGTPVVYGDDSILLTMAPNTVGTLLMGTHYVWYGKISATLTTSQGAGVVTAFIMMSDVKDEIDFEFVGVELDTAQSNYYWQGVTDYDNGANISVSNTVENMHTYTIDWQPDYISWSVDGKVGRTVNKNSTWNSTDNTYHFPQTPSRVQLSLWPAGLASNGKGTIAWAGGLIDWNSPYMQNGYYYARVQDVSVECYNPPAGYMNNGDKTYYYTSTEGVNSSVATGNNNTELASFFATGDEPDTNPDASASGTKTKSATSTATPNMVPGLSGGGNQGLSGSNPDSGNSGNSASSSAGGPQQTGSSGFVQGTGSSSEASTIVAGSAVALLGFIVAALML